MSTALPGEPEPAPARKQEPAPPEAEPDEPPPILGSWPRMYAAVAGFLALLIALFTWFTMAFR
jgi:hypothetical protein